jgi:hypothetical protein
MGRIISHRAALAALCLWGAGCATTPDARYVYQDGEYGVIGIPRNSPLGRKDYREEAYHLMSLHFPEGFEIVRAEEVVEGERVFEAARRLEVDSEPGVSALNQILKIGKFAKSTAIDQKDTVHITESRIIYRRKHDGKSTGHDGFSAIATATPEFYLDPNQAVRKMALEAILVAKKDGENKTKPDDKKTAVAKADEKDGKPNDGKPHEPRDSEVQRASGIEPR